MDSAIDEPTRARSSFNSSETADREESLLAKEKVERENSNKLNLNSEENSDIFQREGGEESLTTTSIFVSVFLASAIFLILWYQKQLKGRLRANQGLPIETLGQTWLDGQTKIIILRIGSKVLILAKSPSFCTTLDTITDPEEVNLLTLGSGTAGKEDFSKLLTQIKNQTGFGKKK
jgi:flagellar biogenesis protein FliO